MKLSLLRAFRSLGKRRQTRTNLGLARKTRLGVERLEERAVPTANINNLTFPIYNGLHQTGLLHITQENFVNRTVSDVLMHYATFSGVLTDYAFGMNVPVAGQLTPLGKWDRISFSGSASNGLKSESVLFKGWASEPNVFPKTELTGSLTQNYHELFFSRLGLYGKDWSTTTYVDSFGSPVVY
jgi:hypothetical protein